MLLTGRICADDGETGELLRNGEEHDGQGTFLACC